MQEPRNRPANGDANPAVYVERSNSSSILPTMEFFPVYVCAAACVCSVMCVFEPPSLGFKRPPPLSPHFCGRMASSLLKNGFGVEERSMRLARPLGFGRSLFPPLLSKAVSSVLCKRRSGRATVSERARAGERASRQTAN